MKEVCYSATDKELRQNEVSWSGGGGDTKPADSSKKETITAAKHHAEVKWD